MLFRRMRAELMNCDVNYDDKLEQKNTQPKLLPELVEMMSTESVELLAKSESRKLAPFFRNTNFVV
jgi:hypothetical protein